MYDEQTIMKRIKSPTCLTICGSDPNGNAGLIVDLKAFEKFKVSSCYVITTDTLQTKTKFISIINRNPKSFSKELRCVLEEKNPDVIKIGLIPDLNIARALTRVIRNSKAKIIVDPISMSSTGFDFVTEKDFVTSCKLLFPLSFCVTPNLKEASILLDENIDGVSRMKEAALNLSKLGSRNVIIKGGHLEDSCKDVVMNAQRKITVLRSNVIQTKQGRRAELRGTGCAYSSALAASIATGRSIEQAAKLAQKYVRSLLRMHCS